MKKYLYWLFPIVSLIAFIVWTVLVKTVDVTFIKDVGYLGFSNINFQINDYVKTLPNDTFNTISNVFLIVSILTILPFAILGVVQWIKRKSLKKVDPILFILLGTYVLIAVFYFVFELYKVNYSPLSIKDDLKASYPSSHGFVTATVALVDLFALFDYINIKKPIKICLFIVALAFGAFALLTRLYSGNHYFTDIVGGVFLVITLVAIFLSARKAFLEKGLRYQDA